MNLTTIKLEIDKQIKRGDSVILEGKTLHEFETSIINRIYVEISKLDEDKFLIMNYL